MPNKETPLGGSAEEQTNPWEGLGQEGQENKNEDLRDDESLSFDERMKRSSKREQELRNSFADNVDELIASERAFRQELMANAMNQDAEDTSNPDINNINDQLDDSDVDDDPIWSAGQDFNERLENGTHPKYGLPKSISDLKDRGYTDEQIDDWVSEGLDPLEEYKNASPAGTADPEFSFRAHEQNGMEQNEEDVAEEEHLGAAAAGGGEDDFVRFESTGNKDEDAEINETAGDGFEKGETDPNGDFGFWLKDKHNLTPAEYYALTPDEMKKINDEYAALSSANGGEAAPTAGENNTENNGEANGTGESKGEEALAFVSLCTEREAEQAAHDIADAMFAERVAHSKGIFKRIIMGNMMKEGILSGYRKKALKAIVAYNAGENGQNRKISDSTIAQYWSKKGGIERFTKAYMEQVMPAIHARAGENMQGYTTRTDENGEIYVVTKSRNENGDIIETRVDADKNPGAKAAIDIRKAIEAYAGGTSDLASLKEQVRRIQQGEGITDEKLDLSVDNLVELAEAAKQRAEHAEGIINVMEGFSYINGEAMRSVRSESHKTNIEKASEFISEHTMGLVSPEVVATAASLMMFFTEKGSKTVASAALPGIGTALVSGAFAGIRERGRVTSDIQTSSREAAMGRDVSGPDGRKGKYDRQVAETLYNMQNAEDMTASLETAIKNGDTDAMQKALANINALVNISDSQKVDLIRYSSNENIEDERMNMDIARAKAEIALKKAGIDIHMSDTYRDAIDAVRSEISRDMDEKDKARSKLKTKRMLAQGAKTATISVVAGTAAREVAAYFNPNQVGILDHVFNKENNYDATNTPLASFLGLKEPDTIIPGEVSTETIEYMTDQELTPSQIAALKSQGYEIGSSRVEQFTTPQTTQVDVSEYAQNHTGGGFIRNWLSNGTEYSDGNEFGVRYDSTHGWYTDMHDGSFGGGISRDFEDDIAAGKVHAFFSFSRGTQSTPIQLSERIFTAPDGTQQMQFFSEDPAIQSLLDQKLGMVEVASETGRFMDDGSPIMDIWGTWGGNDIDGTIQDTIEMPGQRVLYDVYKVVTTKAKDTVVEGADRLIGGIAALPFATRKALHRAKILPVARRNRTPQQNPNPAPTPNPVPPSYRPDLNGENPDTSTQNSGNSSGPENQTSTSGDQDNLDQQNSVPGNTGGDVPKPKPAGGSPENPDPNDISGQYDDNELPDDPNWDPEYHFRAHRQNGMEENADDTSTSADVPAGGGEDSGAEVTAENNSGTDAEAAERERQNEIKRLQDLINDSWNRQQNNMFDFASVEAETAYRQRLEARLNELQGNGNAQSSAGATSNLAPSINNDAGAGVPAGGGGEDSGAEATAENNSGTDAEAGGSESNTGSGQGAETGQSGAGVSGEGAGNTVSFSPENGGEWSVDNLRPLPNDDDFIWNMMSKSSNGQRTIRYRDSDNSVEKERAERIKETLAYWIEYFNRSTTMSPEQRVAVMNGRNPVPPLSGEDNECVLALRSYGILASPSAGATQNPAPSINNDAGAGVPAVGGEDSGAEATAENNSGTDAGAGGTESSTDSGQGTETGQSGAGVSGESASNTAGFSPENGGEWNAGNLRNIPTDKDFVIRSLANTANGRFVLNQRGIPSRFNGIINDLIKAIKEVNSSRLTPDQKAAVFNGGSADNYNDKFRKNIDKLRLYGILPGNA